MVSRVPREVPRQKPEGPQAPRVSGRGTSRSTPFTMTPPRLFHIMSLRELNPNILVRDEERMKNGHSLGANYTGLEVSTGDAWA